MEGVRSNSYEEMSALAAGYYRNERAFEGFRDDSLHNRRSSGARRREIDRRMARRRARQKRYGY